MTQFTITADEWTPITEAGEAMSCWLDEDRDGAGGNVDVRVTHSTEGVPVVDPTECKRIWSPGGNADTVTLNPDNSRDVWYARCKNAGDSATITLDHGLNHVHEVDVNIQSQLNPLVQFYLMRELKTDILLTANSAVDDMVVNVSSGHGFTVGSWIAIWEAGRFLQCEVASVNTDAIGLHIPLSFAFTTSAKVVRGDVNIAIDGSGTPQHFYFRPYNSTIPIDISSAVVAMRHSVEGDDGKFGGISAIANGLLFRRSNGTIQNLGNYKTNQAFREFGWTITYPPKAPAGTYATEAAIRILDVFTQELRFDPREGDYLRVTVRDDLATGGTITRAVVSVLGSYTSGE